MVFRPVTRDQRVGKVATISFAKVSAEVDRVESSATSWYDGTLASIDARLARLKSAAMAARTVLQGHRMDDDDLSMYRQAKLQEFVSKSEREISDLQRVSSEFVDVETQEAIQSLPTYRIAVAGAHRNLGERVAATRVKAEVAPIIRGSQLHEFLHVEPRAFVRENKGLSRGQLRTAAVSYVEQKTANMVNQQVLRTHVVDEFVRRVELLTSAG
ncbi:MAG TPA: hypothetical protein VIY48_05280 [Candidatus Paceibacterota bacterium]